MKTAKADVAVEGAEDERNEEGEGNGRKDDFDAIDEDIKDDEDDVNSGDDANDEDGIEYMKTTKN